MQLSSFRNLQLSEMCVHNRHEQLSIHNPQLKNYVASQESRLANAVACRMG